MSTGAEHREAAAGRVTAARLRGLPSRLLSLTSMHADRLVNDGLAAVGARKWHHAVLAAIEESGPASQSELSRRTGIYRSDLVAVINELADDGLVERHADPADRRRNVITATRAGGRRLRQLDQLLAAIQDAVLAQLSAPERAQLTALLQRLLDHHSAP